MGEESYSLVTLDKSDIVKLVNTAGRDMEALVTSQLDIVPHNEEAQAKALAEAKTFLKTNGFPDLLSHQNRKEFLANKFGIDENTPDTYRLAVYKDALGRGSFLEDMRKGITR